MMSSKSHWHIIPVILTLSGVICVWTAAFITSDVLGNLQWVLYVGGVACFCAVFWFKHELSSASLKFEAQRMAFESEKQALKEDKKRFEHAKEIFEQELEKRSFVIQKKENALAQKLISFNEWMEFPKGIDDQEINIQDVNFSDLHDKDKAVQELLKQQTDILFDKIKNNKYQSKQVFQTDLLFNDLYNIVESVALIYNPDSKNPVLETSVDQLLRSINRTALHILVLLEQLPLDFKSYNLKNIYEIVQTGVKAYSAYKSAVPYWNYLRPVYYLGRFTMGASPITLGMGWALGELAKGSAAKISSHLANRYALNLLYDIVFIIGNEAAGIFGGDFRHRESNWIYGTELTEFIQHLSVSREVLQGGLHEIGFLRLRNEYDRIFLYRCLAAHKSGRPEKFDARQYLSMEECQNIAKRLEKFWEKYIADGEQSISENWKQALENRLGVKVHFDTKIYSKSLKEKAGDALVSLASFLIYVKQCQAQNLPELLSETIIITYLDENTRREIVQNLIKQPPMIFDYPDIEISDTLVNDYLEDLINFCVKVFPYDSAADSILEDTFIHFRKDLKDMNKEIDNIYCNFFVQRLLPQSPEKKVKPFIARTLLSLLNPEEFPFFVYKDIKIENCQYKDLWLIGTQNRLIIAAIFENTEIIWQADKSRLKEEPIKGRFKNDCCLKGGTWHIAEMKNFDLIISGHSITRYETYFGPIIDFIKN